MNSRIHQPSTSDSVHSSSAIAQLIDHDSDFDTTAASWVDFDAQMTAEFAALEVKFRAYFTPTAVREEIGR